MRRLLLILFCVSMFSLQAGCTYELWTAKPSIETYQERISSVLVSKDGKTLVIVGKDYHYIFEMPPIILKTLTSNYQKSVTASFGTFSVDESQKISGNYVLHVGDDVSDEAKLRALEAGFLQDTKGRIVADGTLWGTRYSAGNVKIATGNYALNREYYVDVRAPRSNAAELGKKVLLTPVTVLADGTLVLLALTPGGVQLVEVVLKVVELPFRAAKEIMCGVTKEC